MNLTELQRLAEEAAGYIGEARYWTPYAGARPTECVAFNCGVQASFTAKGMSVKLGIVWTHYMDRGREETVWFPRDVWLAMPLVRARTALEGLK